MCAQDEINQIIFQNKIKETWLAEKLGMTPQALHYQLHLAAKFDADLQKRIKEILRKEGYLTDDKEICNSLINSTLEIGSLIANSIAILNTTVKNATKDQVLDFKERKRLSILIDDMREASNKRFDEIEKLIEG